MREQVVRVAAYGLIADEQGRMLLCRISQGIPNAGEWTLPGGGVEFGEHPEDAARREILEETGLSAELVALATVDSELLEKGERQRHLVRLLYHAEGLGEIRNESEGSTDLCAWHDLGTLDELALVPVARLGAELLRKKSAR